MTSVLPTVNPYALPIAEHPVFVAEARHFRHKPPKHVWLWMALWLSAPALIVFLVCAAFAADMYTLSAVAQIVFAVVILYGVYVDIACLLSSITSLNREVAQVKMDLLRLTPLHEAGIIAAKHGLSLARTRRLTLIMVGARLGLLAATLLYSDLVYGVQGNWGAVIAQLGFVVLIFVIFLLEPFWRNEMMTALGIYVSSLNRSTTSTLLTTGFALGVVWLIGLMTVGVASAGLALMASLLLSNIGYSSLDGALLFGLWFNLFFLVLLGSAIYGFYHLIERWCLRAALRRLKAVE